MPSPDIVAAAERIIARDYWYESGDDNAMKFSQVEFERDAERVAREFKAMLARATPPDAERQRLHGAIMNIPCETLPPITEYQEALRDGYRDGFKAARHAAAELVLKGGESNGK